MFEFGTVVLAVIVGHILYDVLNGLLNGIKGGIQVCRFRTSYLKTEEERIRFDLLPWNLRYRYVRQCMNKVDREHTLFMMGKSNKPQEDV